MVSLWFSDSARCRRSRRSPDQARSARHPRPSPLMFTQFHPRSPNPPKNRQRVAAPTCKHPASSRVLKINCGTAEPAPELVERASSPALSRASSCLRQPISSYKQNTKLIYHQFSPPQQKKSVTLCLLACVSTCTPYPCHPEQLRRSNATKEASKDPEDAYRPSLCQGVRPILCHGNRISQPSFSSALSWIPAIA